MHRDVKPANLMVDARGNLWITDFGLARLQSDSGLTITGDIIGTLRYMSPEQASGKRVLIDGRTDIYSLGVTLYELITLEPACASRDRQELLRWIADQEPLPPRKLIGSIPRDLETILLKAMAKEPESRYATAQDLADDLELFLEHKPIRAKRPTLRERVAKWSRRHPAFLASGCLLLAVVALGLAIGSTLLARKQLEVSRQRDRANESAEVAVVQRALAERNARLARQAIDEMFTQVAEKWLADQPKLEPIQRDFLEKALHYYEELLRQNDPDRSARNSLVDAWARVGDIRIHLGLVKPAEQAFREGLALAQALAVEFPSDHGCRYRLGWAWLRLGNFLLTDGRRRMQPMPFQQVREIAQTVPDQPLQAHLYRELRPCPWRAGACSLLNSTSCGTLRRNWARRSPSTRDWSRRIPRTDIFGRRWRRT